MTIKVIEAATDSEARELQAAVDAAMGYPRKGEHVGGGRHVDMPIKWDGTGECPPGWGATFTEVQHAEDKGFALAIDDADAARIAEKLNVLDEQDRAQIASALASRTDKDLAAEGFEPRSRGDLADVDVRGEQASPEESR